MKKILTVSLFAMMAVSAANADIASTKYVTDRTGTTANLTTTAKELTGAVNELKAKLDTVAGTGEGSVSDQIDSALADYTNTAGMNSAITDAKNELTTEIGKVDDKADANAAAIEAADLAQVGADGSYISAVSQVNGKVSASAVAFKDAIAKNETSANAPTAKAVYDHVQSEMGVLSGNVGTLQTALNNTQSGLSELSGEFDAYVTSNNAAVATKANSADVYTKTAADAEFMNSAEVDAAIAGAVTGTNGALKDYSTTAQMNTAITNANNTQTAAITEAYEAADTATLNAAKADATTKANTAKSEAIAAAKSAGDAAYAAKSYETIVDANEAFREAIASGTTGTDGTYALTATVSNNTVSGYKWELIGR